MNNIEGQIALQEGKRLITLQEPAGLLNLVTKSQRRVDGVAQLEKAARLGFSEALFELGQYYESKNEIEKGFDYFYQGAKLGEKQSQSALKIASFDTNSEKVFLGTLYQGLYLQSSHYLELAQQANEKQFEIYAIVNAQNSEISMMMRLKLLIIALSKAVKSEEILEKLSVFVSAELEKSHNAADRMKFSESLKRELSEAHFIQFVLTLADEGKAIISVKCPLLLSASRLVLTVTQRQTLESHLAIVPDEIKKEHEKYLSAPVTQVVAVSASSSSSLEEEMLAPLTQQNIVLIVQQEVKKLRDAKMPEVQIKAVLTWLTEYPYDETDHAVHINVNKMRGILDKADCELLFYMGAPKNLSSSIQTELQKAAALERFKKQIHDEIKAIVIEPEQAWLKTPSELPMSASSFFEGATAAQLVNPVIGDQQQLAL